jgi:putative peptide zinc metalloprotease protein
VRMAFRVLRVNRDVVDQGNAAVAVNSCEGCQSLAISFQIVLVFSDPSVVTPTNLALAMNIDCIDCAAVAEAYQWVLGTNGNVHFTAEGNTALKDIRAAIRDLMYSDLSLEEIQARLDELALQIEQVLANELVASGPPGTSAEVTTTAEAVPPTGTSPEPASEQTGEASPQPPPSPEESPAGTPSGSTQQSPSPSPSPTPTPSGTLSPSG